MGEDLQGILICKLVLVRHVELKNSNSLTLLIRLFVLSSYGEGDLQDQSMNVNMQIYSFLDTYTRSEITHHTMEPHLTVLSMTLPSHSNAKQMTIYYREYL